jgi:hypothetical protein
MVKLIGPGLSLSAGTSLSRIQKMKAAGENGLVFYQLNRIGITT